MTTKNLLVELGVKDKGATDQIKALNKQMKELNKTYKLNDETLKLQEKSFDKCKNSQRFYGKSVEIVNEKIKILGKALKDVEKNIKDETKANEEAKRKLDEYNSKQKENEATLKKLQSVKEEYLKKIKSTKSVIDEENNKIKENKEEMKRLSDEINKHVAIKKTLEQNRKQNKELIEQEKTKLAELRSEKAGLIEENKKHKSVLADLNGTLNEHKTGLSQAEQSIKDFENNEKDLHKTLTNSDKTLESLNKKHNNYTNQLKHSKAELKSFTEAQKQANLQLEKENLQKQIKQIQDYNDKMGLVVKKHQLIGDSATKVGNGLLALTTPLVGLGVYGVKSAIDFESAFAGVRKTVDATEIQFEKLQDTIVKMSEKLPKNVSDISKVMEVAGQLGVGVNDLERFSEVMIRLGDSTNIASEEAGLLLAQFTNITGLPHTEIERLGSTIVDLGNHTATTEDKIVNMMHRLASGGTVFGLSEHQIAGLSASMSATGIEAEKGGTAMTKFMMKIMTATGKSSEEFKKMGKKLGLTTKEIEEASEKAGDSLEVFCKVTGKTTDEFRKMVAENPSEAIVEIVENLGKMKENGQDIIPVLEALGIKEVRLRETILNLVNGHKHLRNNMNLSKKAWEENTALANESNKRYKTTESQLKVLKNQFQNMAMEIGVQLLPTVIDLMNTLKGGIKWFKGLDEGTKKNIISFTKLVGVLGLALKGYGSLSKGVANLIETGNRWRELSIGVIEQMIKSKEATTGVVSGVGKVTTSLGGLSTMTVGTTGNLSLLGGGLSTLLPILGGVAVAGTALYSTISLIGASISLGKKNITDSVESLSMWEKVVNFCTGTTHKSREELEKMGITYSDTSKLSDGFRQAIENSRTSLADFNYELEKISIDKVFNIEDVKNIDAQLESIIGSAKKTIENQKKEIQEKWKEAFSTDGIFTEKEKKTIEHLTKQKDKIITEISKLEAEIKDIRKKANEEKRDLNNQEVKDIEEKVKKIKELELQTLATSHEDQLYMQNKFRQEIGNLDLNAISEKLQAEKQALDQQTAEKVAWLDTQIQMQRDYAEKAQGQEKENALKAIEQMEQTKEKILAGNREQYDKLLQIIKEKYPELAKEIDEFTGKILSDEDKKLNSSYENWQKYHKNVFVLNKTGWNQIVDETTGATKMVYQVVDESTGKVIACYDNETKEIYAKTEASKKKLEELKNTTEFTQGKMSAEFLRMTQNLTSSTKLNVGQLRYLEEQMGFTKTKTGELTGTIVDLNGHPIKVKVNKDGTVSNLEEIKNKILSIPEKRNVYIGVQYDGYSTGTHLNVRSYNKPNRTNGGWSSGTNYLTGYSSGVNSLPSYSSGGMVRTRVNEIGWELFDLPRNTRGFMIGTHRGDDIMDLPVGTKITNHIASTRLMIDAVKSEVAKRFSSLMNNAVNLGSSSNESTLKQEITFKFEKVVIRDERDIKELVKQIQYELQKGVVN